MADRPLSILSKGQRRMESLIAPDDILRHYEDTFATRFRWLGGPEGMDPSWPERMLYRFGLLGTAEAFGSMQLAGGSVGLRGIYGQPLNWFPKCDGVQIPEGWLQAHEGPTDYLHYIPAEEILPLCELMADAWRCMKSNIKGMSQPIVVQGTIGAELNSKECADSIDGWQPVIFTLDRTSAEAKAIDLGSKDHTESLIKTINDIDCEILARFGIKSAGTEKASGVSPEETLSIAQELRLRLERDLEIRRRFCAEVQDVLPGLRVEPAPGLMDNPYKKEKEGEDDGAAEGGTDTDNAA